VQATAPSRIDLAGGTLDIHPLYLFEEGGITVNMAISLGSHVWLQTRRDAEVKITAECIGAQQHAASAEELRLGGELDLICRIVRYYRPSLGLDIISRNDAPKGSGLGASSSLLIALTGALRELNGDDLSNQDIVRYGANLEAQNLGIPTGKQDYYSALNGGLNAIWFDVEGERVEPLGANEWLLRELEDRLVLTFTGESRCSGTSNWAMLKNYIDDRGTTVQDLRAIKQTAMAMREALLAGDLDRCAGLLDEEWQNRRRLAEGVTNERIEHLMSVAREAGALASRLCGAGGGGCMISFAGAGRAKEVATALVAAGAEHLPYKIDRRGLSVRVIGEQRVGGSETAAEPLMAETVRLS